MNRFGKIVQIVKTDESAIKILQPIKRGGGYVFPGWDTAEKVFWLDKSYALCQLHQKTLNLYRYDLFDLTRKKVILTKELPADKAVIIREVRGNLLYAITEERGYPEILVLKINGI